ncbi:MAG TPA: hypothetical protein VFA09_22295 [Ktedonobacteraceae bacterium]|nr:hypothetical protein [Ktedonobacteraceae bacterium]
MEMKAYMQGILRASWLIVFFMIIGFFICRYIGQNLYPTFTATSTVQVNASLLADNADPTGILKVTFPKTPEGLVDTPAAESVISKHYPRLSKFDLQKDIVVTSDDLHQTIFISMTDITPESALNIDGYLTQTFVDTQNAAILQQVDYYIKYLNQQISKLTTDANNLNAQISANTPPPAPQKQATPPTPAQQQTISEDQYQLDLDKRAIYQDQQSLTSIHNTRSLFSNAFFILQPPTESGAATTAPLSPNILELLGLVLGLLAGIIVIIFAEYFSPFVRHRGEVERLTGLPVFAELPFVFKSELQQALQSRRPFFSKRVTQLQVICAAIGTMATREKGNTILLTSPRKKRELAAILGSTLARNGYRTLLIDLDHEQPALQKQIRRTGPCELITNSGMPLNFINRTDDEHLFLLPARAMIAQNMPLTNVALVQLLPELQEMFDLVIIDAPPLDHGDAHLFTKYVKQIFLLVKKRRDSLTSLKQTQVLTQELKLTMQALLVA